ncbi:AAA family ATPase [Streptomyces sp. NPDC005576]|uniref:AAA family ATPase n=1 Tax=Streptomyces sp. NPDC005576 TaxID=3364726 RepID=UPI0036A45B6D
MPESSAVATETAYVSLVVRELPTAGPGFPRPFEPEGLVGGAHSAVSMSTAAGRAPAVLFGRATELALLDGMVDALIGGGTRPVLLRGASGVGKSSLLDETATRARARGVTVLRAAGAQSEVRLGYSGLHQLMHSLRGTGPRLAAAQQEALDRALGVTHGAPPDRFTLSAATLARLCEVADSGPVLLIVDDAQWMDRASAEVLEFVARRLGRQPIGVLAAVQTGWDAFLDRGSFSETLVGPLDAEAAAALLEARYPALAPATRRRLLSEAAGNPLALLELPALLSEEQLAGRAELPDWLPLNERLEALFAARIRDLPDETRELLLLAALESTGSVRTIWTAARGGWADTDAALVPGERAGLVRVDTRGQLVFRHPLVRSAIVQAVPPDQHRGAHRALADALVAEPERQVGHLISAALGPSEVTARALENAAHHASQHHAPMVALTALRHAAELSTGAEDRSRRLARAALIAGRAGRMGEAVEILASAHWEGASPEDAARAALADAYRAIEGDGDVRATYRMLTHALDELTAAERPETGRPPLGDLADELLHVLMLAAAHSGRAELWEPLASRVAGASEFTRLCFDAAGDPARHGRTLRRRLDSLLGVLAQDSESRRYTRLRLAAGSPGTAAAHRTGWRRTLEPASGSGTFSDWATAVTLRGVEDFHAGRWDTVESTVPEAVARAEELGHRTVAGRLKSLLALVHGARGQVDALEPLYEELKSWTAARGLGTAEQLLWQAQGLAALAHGDHDRAYRCLVRITPAGTFRPYTPLAVASVMDLVEAAVRSGRTGEGRAHVAAAEEAGLAEISPRIALLVAGCQALIAPAEGAAPAFEAALSLPEAEQWPFEHARLQLAYGRVLQSNGSPDRATTQLRAAREALERLGAEPWAERARAELRAAGAVPDPDPGEETGPVGLTAQEMQIARLAATGLSNKQIASQLFLSHRTVSTHLYNLFPKLRITSRAALRDALKQAGLH